ncbi:TMEM91 [Mytilus edulis]|uniref:TMEM91 n=1 Tax=Mytilus edulis TaxID=6550 RepID=A0A8S3S1N2_MYTED|nr:TMEM91 [Mytilus edulis]
MAQSANYSQIPLNQDRSKSCLPTCNSDPVKVDQPSTSTFVVPCVSENQTEKIYSGKTQGKDEYPPDDSNHFCIAVCTCVLCFWPLGLVAICTAMKASIARSQVDCDTMAQSSIYSQIPLNQDRSKSCLPTCNSDPVNVAQPTTSTYVVPIVFENQTEKIYSGKRQEKDEPDDSNYLCSAVFAFLCCFWPLGVVAISTAIKASNARSEGDYDAARRYNRLTSTLIGMRYEENVTRQNRNFTRISFT